MIQGVVITMLTVEALSDIRTKTISVVRQVCFLILAAVLNILFYYQSAVSMAGGIGIGVLLFLYAFFTKEGIGYGDCLVFACVGAYVGLMDNIRLLFFSLIIAAVAGIIYSLVKKKKITDRIPFLPCVLLAYLAMSVAEVFI